MGLAKFVGIQVVSLFSYPLSAFPCVVVLFCNMISELKNASVFYLNNKWISYALVMQSRDGYSCSLGHIAQEALSVL